VSALRLPRALAASAALHLGLAAGLLALAHPRLPSAPAMRVTLVGTPAAGGASGEGSPPEASGRGAGLPERRSPATGSVEAPAPQPRPSRHAARRSEADAPVGETGRSTASAIGQVVPVQSDIWMLGAAAPPARAPGAEDAQPGGAEAYRTEGPGGGGGQGPGSNGQGPGAPGPGSGGTSTASLLAALSERLAWSAERCAPPSATRLTHRPIPGVPLHFCLDAAGRPTGVGLLGTTGSEQLDRAARDCVVAGAMPLPPVPGCYTVEVRFPIRG
jgi:hypothetical protein